MVEMIFRVEIPLVTIMILGGVPVFRNVRQMMVSGCLSGKSVLKRVVSKEGFCEMSFINGEVISRKWYFGRGPCLRNMVSKDVSGLKKEVWFQKVSFWFENVSRVSQKFFKEKVFL
jgi:hypothetical protein